jgi:hypothetical protein
VAVISKDLSASIFRVEQSKTRREQGKGVFYERQRMAKEDDERVGYWREDISKRRCMWPRGFQEVKVARFHDNGTVWW